MTENYEKLNQKQITLYSTKDVGEYEDNPEELKAKYLSTLRNRFNKWYGPFKNRHHDWYFFLTADVNGVFEGLVFSLGFEEESIMFAYVGENGKELGHKSL